MLDHSLTEHIEAELRARIVSGQLAFGARVSDRAVALELNVSRTPVREALLKLKSQGFIVVRPQSGTFVFEPGPDEVRQICDLRGVYEAGALRLAVAHDCARAIATLTGIVARAALALEAGDLAACDHQDTAFHESLVRLSGNAYLVEAYQAIADKVRALRTRLEASAERLARATSQHRRVIDLAAADRLDAACSELIAHMSNVHAQLTAAPERFDR
jgi:DNA-binding GntR family transcriptional regulator